MYSHPERERSLDFGCGQAPAAFSGVRAWQTEDTWLSSPCRPTSCSFRCDFYLAFKERGRSCPCVLISGSGCPCQPVWGMMMMMMMPLLWSALYPPPAGRPPPACTSTRKQQYQTPPPLLGTIEESEECATCRPQHPQIHTDTNKLLITGWLSQSELKWEEWTHMPERTHRLSSWQVRIISDFSNYYILIHCDSYISIICLQCLTVFIIMVMLNYHCEQAVAG